MEFLAELGVRTSLRYAIQLLNPANVLRGINGGEEVGLDEVREVDRLFFDAKASAHILQTSGARMIV
jgi:RuvB-like protein 1 (pontin 52)